MDTLNRYRHILLILVVLLLSLRNVRDVHAQSNDVKIIQSNNQSAVIEYTPLYMKSDTIMIDGSRYIGFPVSGGVTYGRLHPGEPGLSYRGATLRFQGIGGNRVEIITAEYTDLPSIRIAPVPSFRKGTDDHVRVYSINKKAYAKSGFLPEQLVTLDRIGETRGVILGSVSFAPIQFNPSLGTVRKYSRIVARVLFGPPSAVSFRADKLSRNIALNDRAGVSPVSPVRPRRATAQVNSVLTTGTWFRFPVTAEGMYKLTGQVLLDAGIPASADPATIRIFGNGGFEVPTDVTLPYYDDLVENAIYLHDGGTAGKLDAADYIIFYGKGTRGWAYTPSTKTFNHYLNHYTETNYYWLTYGGAPHLAMAPLQKGNTATPYQPGSLACKTFYEDDEVNLLASGLEWLGPAMNPGDQRVYVTPLPGLDVTQQIHYRLHVGAQSSQDSYMGIFEHSTPIGAAVYLPGTTIGDDFSYQFIDAIVDQTLPPTFSDNQSQIRLSYVTNSADGNGYLDWFELFYAQHPSAQNNLAVFSAPDTSAIVRYAISGFTAAQVYVFDVTNFNAVSVDDTPARSADTCFVQLVAQAGSARQVYVAGAFKTPGALTQVANQNLHGDTAQADCIIISHADFISAANRLKNYREQSAKSPIRVKVVDVNQVYNEFGGGLLSPAAIRNYLRYLSNSWSTPPAYLLLFGSGSYDYRGILGPPFDGVPPWETEESYLPIESYASDDDFANFNPSLRVNMGVGRLTARSPQDANTMVDKIIDYETHSVEDPWRIRVTFVADDAWSGIDNGVVENDGTIHMDAAEACAALLPSLFEQRKIYEFAYPTVDEAGGRRKPTCNQAIDNQINEGTLVMNYNGHGNPDLWAHEHVFVRETDFPLLTNKGKYVFLVAATCNFSAYDQLGPPSGGEALSSMPNAGACAVFSAIRPVIASENLTLNLQLFTQLFRTDSSGRMLPERLGDVLYRTKQIQNDDNDRKYFLLGDPALTIGFPRLFARVDSINNIPGNQQTQLQALSKTSISATVRDSLLNLNTAYSGSAQIDVYDAEQTISLVDPYAGPVSWKTTGSVLFRGAQSVSSGALTTKFIVPKDISYGNAQGRVSIYSWNATTDGAGYSTNFTVGGSDTNARPDTKGPDIQLYLDNRGFRSGDIVSGSPVLIADLSDSSGINTSASGIGHRMELWLDNNPQSIDVGAYYQTKPNTYQEGTIDYPMGSLAEGSHNLRLRVWDTYDNPSSKETVFEVLSGSGLQLSNVYNFPNPFRSSTAFTFQHNQVIPVDAQVKIFTVAGRLIQTLQVTNVTTQFVQIPWDGRDRDGDAIASGIYLYKIIASTHDHRLSTEAVGKLSVAR